MPKLSTTTHLQCLQVWGGSEAADQTLKMTGLDGYLYARPHEGAHRGGDVYYVSSCASGRITRVIIADVAGHGGKVATIAEELRKLMQRYVNFTSQPRFMKELNQNFAEVTEAGRFATTVAMSFFAPTRKLSLSNAGHPAPLWFRNKNQRWIALGIDPQDDDNAYNIDLPLGVEDNAGYQQIDICFEPGDMLLMYTDALIESRTPEGGMLGVRGLADRLNAFEHPEPAKLVDQLIRRLVADDASDLKEDDVTVLLIAATGQRSTWRKTLMGPVHVVRGLFKGVPVGVG